MGQQERKLQEARLVRRLTVGAGTTALGLAGYFTISAATAAPATLGIQPAAGVQPTPVAEPGDPGDKIFVRRLHVSAVRPPAGGVQPAGHAAAAAAVQAAQPATAAQPAPVSTGPATAPAPVAPPAPAPTPKPVATTGPTPVK